LCLQIFADFSLAMAAAMASMTLQLGAVAPGARRTSLFKPQGSSNSWICRAANDEGTPDVSKAGGDVATAVKEVRVHNDFFSLFLYSLSIFRSFDEVCFDGSSRENGVV